MNSTSIFPQNAPQVNSILENNASFSFAMSNLSCMRVNFR